MPCAVSTHYVQNIAVYFSPQNRTTTALEYKIVSDAEFARRCCGFVNEV